jgi:effector-binding domain-containing protein
MNFEGYPSEPLARLVLNETEEGTSVTWTYEEENTPGLFRIGNLFNVTASMLEDPYAEGLSNLKTYVENLPEKTISVTSMPAINYAGITTTVESSNSEAISNAMAESYGKLTTYVGNEDREMLGMPFAIYTSFDDTSITMICAIPIDTEGLAGTEEIALGEVVAGNAVKAIHTGPYEDLHLTHTAVDEYMQANGLTPAGPPYEMYITDPGLEPNPSKWITWVVYPI